ncbi:MAG: hypothetical protein C5B46_01525 [Proteobacteria bacterium]|nr:MAG: hypothetical protein C5B46_01525 [Pseudomonadota bacterium]
MLIKLRAALGAEGKQNGGGMRFVFGVGLLFILTACASAPHQQASNPQSWHAYRMQVQAQRDSGALTPQQSQRKLEDRYRELYGDDPLMDGAFAYGEHLYASAQAGDLPVSEAEALADARLDEIEARREAQAQFHNEMEQRFPPEPSD